MATTKNNWSTDRISNMVISNLITYDPEELEPELTFNVDDITFKAYFD